MLVDALGKVGADRRIVLLQALGRRPDAAAAAPMLALAKNSGETKELRLAAVRALGELQAASQDLLELSADANSEIAQAAQEGLAAMVDRGLEDQLVKMLQSDAKPRRLLALELLGRCRATSAFAAVLRAAEDADPDVRRPAMKRLGELGSPADLAKLVDLIARAKADEVDEVEQAMRTVCVNAADAKVCVRQLAGLLPEAGNAQKASLLRVLGGVGAMASTEALPLIEPHLQDAAVRDEAVAAVVSIAEKLLAGNDAAQVAAKLIAPLRKAAESGASAPLVARAKAALAQAQAKADGK
jgi:HEAT repeat protein